MTSVGFPGQPGGPKIREIDPKRRRVAQNQGSAKLRKVGSGEPFWIHLGAILCPGGSDSRKKSVQNRDFAVQSDRRWVRATCPDAWYSWTKLRILGKEKVADFREFYFLHGGCPWSTFGSPWRDFAFHLAPFGVHRVPVGAHLAPFGSIWWSLLGPFGSHVGQHHTTAGQLHAAPEELVYLYICFCTCLAYHMNN